MYHLAGTSVAWTLEVFAITGVAHSLKPFPTWFAVQRTVTWSFRGILYSPIIQSRGYISGPAWLVPVASALQKPYMDASKFKATFPVVSEPTDSLLKASNAPAAANQRLLQRLPLKVP